MGAMSLLVETTTEQATGHLSSPVYLTTHRGQASPPFTGPGTCRCLCLPFWLPVHLIQDPEKPLLNVDTDPSRSQGSHLKKE